jgi:hypothetical protein
MHSLKNYTGKTFLIKLVGQNTALFDCKLEAVDDHGIWVTGQDDLMRELAGNVRRADLAFVPYPSIQWMTTVLV